MWVKSRTCTHVPQAHPWFYRLCSLQPHLYFPVVHSLVTSWICDHTDIAVTLNNKSIHFRRFGSPCETHRCFHVSAHVWQLLATQVHFALWSMSWAWIMHVPVNSISLHHPMPPYCNLQYVSKCIASNIFASTSEHHKTITNKNAGFLLRVHGFSFSGFQSSFNPDLLGYIAILFPSNRPW